MAHDDDGSLNDLLLEVAGRSKGSEAKAGAPGRTPSKRRGAPLHDSSSDDLSDSKSDDDFDEDDDYERRGSSRKGQGSKMPLKKRFDSADKDEEEAPMDGYESDLSFGTDLYKDDEDRASLAAMTELDREMILHDRAEAKDNLAMRKKAGARHAQVEGKNQKPREKDVGPPSSRMRSSNREPTKSVKQNALHELVAARRQKLQDPESQRKNRDRTDSASRDRTGLRNQKSRDRSFSDSESDSDDEEESSRDDDDRSDGVASDDDRRKDEPDADVNDILSITIRRSKLAKWFMEPFFEEVIIGCFVRIGIGVSSSGQSIYRVCLVKNVDAKDPNRSYKFENRITHKYLNCIWGDENSAARWQMVRTSDQAPTEKEVNELFREVERVNGRKLTKADVEEKREALAKVNSFVYSAAAVKQMLQEKKQATARPSNIALEKDRIMKDIALAESKGDHTDVDKLQARLKALEDYTLNNAKSKGSKALALAEMNRRNKFENFKNASELKPVNSDAKAGEAGYDPFSRRWTRSQNYYKAEAPKIEKEAAEAEGKASAEDKALENGAQDKFLNRVTPLDGKTHLFALHDFDIPISLAAIQQFGGSQGAHLAYMARKQKLEASCGAQIDNNDGRRHTLTLTVNDYKRRRGLL